MNAVGYSTPSPANTVGSVIQSVPTVAPTLTKGASSSDTAIFLSWNSIASSGGSSVTGYKIYKFDGTNFVLLASVSTSPTTY
jgi:hypothetical protein